MTAKERDQKLTQITAQIGFNDLIIRAAQRKKDELFRQYEDTQKAPVEDAAPENANG